MTTQVFKTKTALPKNGRDNGNSVAYRATSLMPLIPFKRKVPSTFRKVISREVNEVHINLMIFWKIYRAVEVLNSWITNSSLKFVGSKQLQWCVTTSRPLHYRYHHLITLWLSRFLVSDSLKPSLPNVHNLYGVLYKYDIRLCINASIINTSARILIYKYNGLPCNVYNFCVPARMCEKIEVMLYLPVAIDWFDLSIRLRFSFPLRCVKIILFHRLVALH